MTEPLDRADPPPGWDDWARAARREYLRMTKSRRQLLLLVAIGAEFEAPPETRDRLTKAELAAVADALDAVHAAAHQ